MHTLPHGVQEIASACARHRAPQTLAQAARGTTFTQRRSRLHAQTTVGGRATMFARADQRARRCPSPNVDDGVGGPWNKVYVRMLLLECTRCSRGEGRQATASMHGRHRERANVLALVQTVA